MKDYLNKLNINQNPKVVAVSKTFEIDKVLPLIEYGHIDYGENKIQEAVCLLYTSPSPRDGLLSRMPSSA